jgi:TonB family protein
MQIRRLAAVSLAVPFVFAAAALAQKAPVADTGDPTRFQNCVTIADTARNLPRPGQVHERTALRDTLVMIAHRFGVAEPHGLLFVAVDTGTMRGMVRFLESNLPDTAVQASTRLVERYLSTLTPGRGFQILVRIDGGYPVMAPGKRLCQPADANGKEIHDLMAALIERHPEEGRPKEGESRSAVVRLVVDRDGKVAFVHVERPTGDAFYDQFVEELASRIRFYPARLDGTPFDTRIRYTLTFAS